MSKFYGLWVDHAHAFLVKADENEVRSVLEIKSEVEPHHHTGENIEHLLMTDPISDNKRREHQFHDYCKEIHQYLKDADEILIVGPGEAKHKFKIELKKLDHLLADKIQEVETLDQLTEPQLRSYVKDFFRIPRS
jgi:hypothetical protein